MIGVNAREHPAAIDPEQIPFEPAKQPGEERDQLAKAEISERAENSDRRPRAGSVERTRTGRLRSRDRRLHDRTHHELQASRARTAATSGS